MDIKLNIHIDDRLVGFLKRGLTRRAMLSGVAVLAVASSVVYAASITKPNHFTDGQAISASAVNANFDALYTEVNAKDSRIGALETYQGFSYYGTGVSHPAGWGPINNINNLDFNTFGAGTYDGATSTFTAPKAGFYRFSSGGYIATAGTANERIAIGIYRNGALRAFSGGQFAAGDTPGPQFTHVIKLNAGDKISLYAFTALNCTIGGGSGHNWWFQGEYVGQ